MEPTSLFALLFVLFHPVVALLVIALGAWLLVYLALNLERVDGYELLTSLLWFAPAALIIWMVA